MINKNILATIKIPIKIPNNILLQANNNPSTLEELSIELGVALPYMEEEVNLLHQATLLEKQGDKYIIKVLKGIDDGLLNNEKYILSLVLRNDIKNIKNVVWKSITLCVKNQKKEAA